MGIEPTFVAWEATVLPLYDARSCLICLPHALAGWKPPNGPKTRAGQMRM